MMSLKKDDTEMTEDFVVGGLDEHRSHANTVMGSCNMPKEEVSNDSSKLSQIEGLTNSAMISPECIYPQAYATNGLGGINAPSMTIADETLDSSFT